MIGFRKIITTGNRRVVGSGRACSNVRCGHIEVHYSEVPYLVLHIHSTKGHGKGKERFEDFVNTIERLLKDYGWKVSE